MEQRWNDIDRGKPKDLEKNLSSATFSNTNLIWTALGSNRGLWGKKAGD
jgi:hypothetical protein